MPSPQFLDRLGHSFRRPELLAQALTHRSFGATHNERLEFVGDAVLNCAIAAVLYERFPAIPEGELSRVRASLVNRDTLARHALGLGLGAEIALGEGEVKSGGNERPSILADALEAVFGAVFIDAGFGAARGAIERIDAAAYADLDPATLGKDPKTRLQEWLQARRIAVPEYVVVGVDGEPHAQTFTIECRIPALTVVARGTGTNRRTAEQSAAAQAFTLASAQSGDAQ
jgi:ribonuclease-3